MIREERLSTVIFRYFAPARPGQPGQADQARPGNTLSAWECPCVPVGSLGKSFGCLWHLFGTCWQSFGFPVSIWMSVGIIFPPRLACLDFFLRREL